MECRLAYSREWAIRITHEQQCHAQSSFLTLTYDDEHLPAYGQLVKKDLQDFFKRMRKHFQFRYVACGEYGELKRRPHFHVALFGRDFREDRLPYSQGIQGDLLYQSPFLFRTWGKGTALIGSLTFESAAYIGRYITKRISGPNASPMPLACDPNTGELVMPNPEFLLCSKGRKAGQGIGGGWFDRYFFDDVFPHGRVITAQGSPAPIPTYYKRRIAANAGLKMELQHRIRLNSETETLLANKRLEDSPGRRTARSTYAKARQGTFKRDIK